MTRCNHVSAGKRCRRSRLGAWGQCAAHLTALMVGLGYR